jgi:membrane-associated protease RseP (regulator of RpoE activity)
VPLAAVLQGMKQTFSCVAFALALTAFPGAFTLAADAKPDANPDPKPSARAEHGVGFIGVSIDEVDDAVAYHLDLKNDLGIMVMGVSPGSPAESMGLKQFDVIVAADGQPIYTPRAFSKLVQGKAVGEQIQITVRRGPRSEDLVGKIAARPAELADSRHDGPPWFHHGSSPAGANGERRGKLRQPDGSTMEWSIEDSPTPPSQAP